MRKTREVARAGNFVRALVTERPPRAASLLVTVFGDVVVPHGGVVGLGSLVRWLAAFGVNERAVRTAAHRLAADGQLETETIGRRSDYRVAAASRHAFADAERRIYGSASPPWDGTWCLVAIGHGGMSTATRDAVRRELRWHGFGELAPTVLVHPSADLAELDLALRDRGVADDVVVMRARGANGLPGAHRSLRTLVESAWDLRDLAAGYRAYVARFTAALRRVARALPSPEACFVLRVLAIHEYRRILLRDPELPAELLPEDWIGGEAREACAALYRLVEASAEYYVRETGSTARNGLPPASQIHARRFAALRSDSN
jgi:phenylacetic acid degradation operon negative regulatory protein